MEGRHCDAVENQRRRGLKSSMLSKFFIDRPIFAWVIAIFIMLAGAIAVPRLPVSQYPNVAPPELHVYTHYAGASPEEIYQSVTEPIEQQLNTVPNVLYFESTSDSSGLARIVVTFNPGTDLNQASVDTQNAVNRVIPQLPEEVQQQGVQISHSGSGFLMFIGLKSTNGSMSAVALGDYLNRNVIGEIERIPGVGQAQLFSPQRALRIWMDPDKMLGLKLTVGDVMNAIRAQNAQVSAGRIGSKPNPINQQTSATVLVKGQLTTPEEFGDIVLRANPDGSTVRLHDVARVAIGADSYNFSTRIDGEPAAGIGVQLSPSGNALATSDAVRAKMKELAKFFPPGIEYVIPYDTSPFVRISIEKVLETLAEAMVARLHRDVPVPSEHPLHIHPGDRGSRRPAGNERGALRDRLFDQCADDVRHGARHRHPGRRCHRCCRERRAHHVRGGPSSARSDTKGDVADHGRHHRHLAGADRGVRADGILPGGGRRHLPAVQPDHGRGDPVLGLHGAVADAGAVRQLPEARGEGPPSPKGGFFGWFNRGLARTTRGYTSIGRLGDPAHRPRHVIYLALLVGLGWLFVRLPSSFLPNEDQGFVMVDMQTPPEASQQPHTKGGREGRDRISARIRPSTIAPSSRATASPGPATMPPSASSP